MPPKVSRVAFVHAQHTETDVGIAHQRDPQIPIDGGVGCILCAQDFHLLGIKQHLGCVVKKPNVKFAMLKIFAVDHNAAGLYDFLIGHNAGKAQHCMVSVKVD